MKKTLFKMKKIMLSAIIGLCVFSSAYTQSGGIVEGITNAINQAKGEGEGESYGPDINGSEKAAAEAVKAEMDAKDHLITLQEKLKKTKGDTSLLEKQISEAKADLAVKEAQRIEAAEKLIEAYRELGDIYVRAGRVGDPVQIGTGEYVYEKEDFIAEDYLRKFTVYRNYNTNKYPESFGKNWSCSLDSRIIRGRDHDVTEIIAKLNSQKTAANEYLTQLNHFKEVWGHYPDSEEDPISEIQTQIENINNQLEYQTEIDTENKMIDELNKYSAYGYYSNLSNQILGTETLIFIDENGNSILCTASENKKWIPINEKLSFDFYIMENDGYSVIYRDGLVKSFSKYGILQSITDANSNITSFYSNNGLVSKIINKTGEQINIDRNSKNQIVKIYGKTSGTAQFLYNQDNLVFVCNNNNIAESYKYNSNGLLSEIITGPDNSIKIKYEFYSSPNKYLVSEVENPEGYKESFDYDLKNNKVFHTTIAGTVETYELNPDGSTKQYENDSGILRKFEFNDKNQLAGIYENQQWKYFTYDNFHQPVSIHFEDGSTTFTEYNDFGQITFQSDKDGFTNEFIYDQQGNLIETKFCDNIMSRINYYPNGMIKSITENDNTYFYKYNEFGSITKKITSTSEFNDLTEKWIYDSENRVIKYINYNNQFVEYFYDENSMTEITANKKTEHFYDFRKMEIETKETDLRSGITLCKKVIYDKICRPVEIKLNENKFRTYEYDKSFLMTTCTTWDLNDNTKGIKRKYEYDSKNRLIKESSCFVENNLDTEEEILFQVSYEDLSNGFIMNVRKGSMASYKYFYNNKGQLLKIQRPNGEFEIRTYTKNNKIDSISTDKNRTDFLYTNDGKTEIQITNFNSTTQKLVYNNYGQLIYMEDSDGSKWERFFDSKALLIEENGPGYKSYYKYDNNNRLISKMLFDKNNNLCFQTDYEYDDENLILRKTEGNKYISYSKFDCWGRLLEEQNHNGTTKYQYDILGNCISKEDGNGIKTVYNYNQVGKLENESINETTVRENQWSSSGKILQTSELGFIKKQWDYDSSGNCISYCDNFGNQQNFSIDTFGYITSTDNYETGKINITTDFSNNRTIYSKDSNSIYIEEFDKNNNLIAEINSIGDKATYSYNQNNRISQKIDFEGNTYDYEYSLLSEKTIFNNQEEYETEKNPLGLITKISTPEGSIDYSYDTGARLIEINDTISNIHVYYDYDNSGRCVAKWGNNFSIKYEYDNSGKLVKVYTGENSSSIQIGYDYLGREISRKFSNGVNVFSEYNQNGQKIAAVAKEPYGVVITGEYILYDNYGRKKISFDQTGKITRYFYDDNGRLISTLYNYNDEIITAAKNEAIECGIYISEDRPKGTVLNLSYDDYDLASNLLRKSGIFASIDRNQYCWFEKYTYTDFGSIASVENSFGTILYDYDSENRLIHKHGKQTLSGGIKYQWSKNGNLQVIESNQRRIEYQYGIFNRPVEIISKDFNSGNVSVTKYTYDSLGRRLSEEINGTESHRFLYDGFSHNILIDTPVMSNKISSMNYSFNKTFTESESYRTLNLRDIENNKSIKIGKHDEKEPDNTSLISFENTPCVSIYANGIPSAYYYPETNNTVNNETDFIIVDNTQSSIKSIIDSNGNCINIHDYNTWGEPCSKTQVSSKGVSISNSVNTLFSSILTYDLGNRDYIPSMKSFTTKDPKKAGFNWYAYCSCDPVNYKDILGYEKSCLSPLAQARYNEGVAQHLLFKEEEYHNTGKSAGISVIYDCADVSGAVDANASTYAGISGYSVMADAYREKHNDGKYAAARQEINSWSFFTGDTDINVRQTSEGFNRNEYRKGNGQEVERAATYENLQNPDIISPGTVLVWTNPDHVDGKNWIGHTMTVLARDFDSEGNVIGFAYIEGHITGHKTELGYMGTNSTWKPGIATVDHWIGNFLGTFEIEGKNAIVNCN